MNEFAHELKISIDSKIKRAEFNMGKLISPYMPSVKSNHKSDNINRASVPTFVSSKLYNERMFSLIEQHSNQICRLNFIRSKINSKNAIAVNHLLESEEYMQWDKKQLRSFFENV